MKRHYFNIGFRDNPVSFSMAALMALAFALIYFMAFSADRVLAEEPADVTQTGELVIEIADYFEDNRAELLYFVKTDKRTYPLSFIRGSQKDHGQAGDKVKVTGRPQADGSLLLDGPESIETISEASEEYAADELAAPISKNVAVILVNFTDNTSQPWTKEAVSAAMFTNTLSMEKYYEYESKGQLAISGNTFGWFAIPYNDDTCSYQDWRNAAIAAAENAGMVKANYTNFMIIFPKVSACGWSGLGSLPGSNSWLNGTISLRTSAHELGHNLGMHHASSYKCTSGSTPVALSDNCTQGSEYSDPLDIMGAASQYHNHTGHLYKRLALIPETDVRTVAATGNYTLNTQMSTGVRLLKILRPDGSYLYLDYRRANGNFETFSSNSAYANGVAVRIVKENTRSITHLLDANPSTSSLSDALIQVGNSLHDPITSVTITTLSVGAGSATVKITFGGDGYPPTTPTNLTTTQVSNDRVDLSWTASTDNVGVVAYEVYVNGAYRGKNSATKYAVTGLSPGVTYTFAVLAYDAAGNKSPQVSRSYTIPAGDATAPSAPTNLTGTVRSSSRIDLTWNAATDNVGVTGYEVYVNGTLHGKNSLPQYAVTGLAPGTSYTFAIRAYDAAANKSSAASITKSTLSAADTAAPSAPSDLVANTRGETRIDLSWTASTDNVGVAGYQVYVNDVLHGKNSLPQYAVTGLASGTSYTFAIRAYDAAGNLSGAATIVQSTATAYTAITGLIATPMSSSRIDLAWDVHPNGAVYYYKVYLNGVYFGKNSLPRFAATDLAADTEYTFSVRGYDSIGNETPAASVVTRTEAENSADPGTDPNSGSGSESEEFLLENSKASLTDAFRLEFVADTSNANLWRAADNSAPIKGGVTLALEGTSGVLTGLLLQDAVLNGKSEKYWTYLQANFAEAADRETLGSAWTAAKAGASGHKQLLEFEDYLVEFSVSETEGVKSVSIKFTFG